MEHFSEKENQNIFAEYLYSPPITYNTSSTPVTENLSVATTSNGVKIFENNDHIKKELHLDKNIHVNNFLLPKLNKSTLNEVIDINDQNAILNDNLDDDFQECQLQNKIKCNLSKGKKHADESFFCAVCKMDLTNSNLEERSTHINECIDYHSSVASNEGCSSQTSSAFILDCPLCFKHFPSPELRSTHIKKCGKSRGLSVQSVIQAIHLQEKHVLERRALGLPLHRTNQPKQQKKNAPKKFSVLPKSAMQADLLLAKALSLSLKENESQSQQNFSASSSSNMDVQVIELQAPSESQIPGRNPTKRKKLMNCTYPLILRTQQEREKITLEKVNALIAPMCQSELDINLTISQTVTENQKIPQLWNLSSKSEDKSSYYVQQLLDWILPSDVEAGSKLCNLSQIPGHRICTQLPCDYTFSSDKTMMDGEALPENSQLPSLVSSLQSLIGNSWMSDIDIQTASGIVIPAHKLILALRCTSLREAFDEPVSGGKHILNWKDTSFDAALHFLNFLYTGTTEWKEDVFDELVHLAKRYEVKDLLYILNNSCETTELFTDENSTMTLCKESNKDDVVFIEEESSGSLVCFNNHKEELSSPSIHSVKASTFANDINSENIKICDIQEQSFNFNKEINKSITVSNSQAADYLSTDYTNTVQVLKPSGSYTEIIPCKNIPGELYIAESKFNDLTTEANKDLNSACIENTACKGKIESHNTESESSNDSCKIVSAEMAVAYTLKKSFTHQCTFSPMAGSTTQNWITKNNTSPKLFSCDKCPNKICVSDKYECLCSDAIVTERNFITSSEDIVVLDECKELRNKVKKISPISFKGESPLKKHYKVGRISEEFSDSFFHVYGENDDLNSAVCLSQNASLQDEEKRLSKHFGFNLNDSNVSITSPKTTYSLPKHLHENFDQIQIYKESDKLAEIITSKTSADFSKQILVDADNLSQETRIQSPEVFVCDSDTDLDSILGPNYFHHQNNFTEKRSLECSSSTVIEKQNSKNFCSSPIKYDANFSNSPVSKSQKRLSPEIICCDSSSEDSQDLATRIQSLQKTKEACREVLNTSPLQMPVNLQVENVSENIPTSPESPWVFQAGKGSNHSEDSASSAKLNTCPASVCIQRKIQNNMSPLRDTNKNSLYPSTPTSSLAPKFKLSDSPITPFPDYNVMPTPEIRKALKRIGVKALPRKKAVAILSHVYEETHPWNDTSLEENHERHLKPELQSSIKISNNKKTSVLKKRKQTAEISDKATKKTCSAYPSQKKELKDDFIKEAKGTEYHLTQPTVSSKKEDNLVCFSAQTSGDNMCISPTGSSTSREDDNNEIFFSELSDNDQPEFKGNTESIKEYILSNEDLYKRVLSYTALNLNDLQKELKENGLNISIKKLMDYLDEQCITFTCPRKEEYKKKQQVRTQRFRKRMISKLSQQSSSNPS